MMSGNPFFSVVLPNFNHGCYLKDAIDSVINQDYKNWELLIIDNDSTCLLQTSDAADDSLRLNLSCRHII